MTQYISPLDVKYTLGALVIKFSVLFLCLKMEIQKNAHGFTCLVGESREKFGDFYTKNSGTLSFMSVPGLVDL